MLRAAEDLREVLRADGAALLPDQQDLRDALPGGRRRRVAFSIAVLPRYCENVLFAFILQLKKDYITKQWKKEQASHCGIADVCLLQSVNQLYSNQNMAKFVLFFII